MAEVDTLKKKISLSGLLDLAQENDVPSYDFMAAIKKPGLSVIAELKKASPSKGVIRENFDPPSLAKSFADNDASCLSVLTDRLYFLGDPAYVIQAKEAAQLPVLRKDFIIDPIQIAEAKAIGADAILLIMACLEPVFAQTLLTYAKSLDLAVLVEVHNDVELKEALNLDGLDLIGFNNRDLSSFETNLAVAPSLREELIQTHPNILTVAESGYRSQDDLDLLAKLGFDAVLVGEGLAKGTIYDH